MRLTIDIYNGRVAIDIKNSKMEVVPMYKALDIAYYLIALAGEEGISNLKLQKMLYFIQKESVLRNKNLIFSDEIEAWKFGPVVPNIYYKFAGRASLPITVEELSLFNDFQKPSLDNEALSIVKDVFNRYNNKEVWEIVRETHKENGAWDRVFCNGFGAGDNITLEDIKRELNL